MVVRTILKQPPAITQMHDETKDHQLIGIFEKDAPGAYGRLSKLFSGEELARLSQAYSLAADNRGNDEDFLRTTGASFNPLPGRICHILLTECGESGFLVFESAILACAEFEEAEAQRLPPAARDARGFFAAGAAPGTSAAERIGLALHLDRARHLHMLRASDDLITDIFEETRIVAERGAKFPENERLIVMLKSWATQYERRAK